MQVHRFRYQDHIIVALDETLSYNYIITINNNIIMEHNSGVVSNSLTFKSCNKSSKLAAGTAVQDYINTSYDNLVNHFGEPTIETDGYKTSSEWHVGAKNHRLANLVINLIDSNWE